MTRPTIAGFLASCEGDLSISIDMSKPLLKDSSHLGWVDRLPPLENG